MRKYIGATLVAAALMGAGSASAHTGIAYCAGNYCTHPPFTAMTLKLAGRYALRYERWYLRGTVRSVRVSSCAWQRRHVLARCQIRVRMTLFIGDASAYTVVWADRVDNHGLTVSVPSSGRVLGTIRI